MVAVMLKPKPPCVSDCLRRSITCHAECREYADYAGRLKKYNDAVKAEKRKGADARDLRSEQVFKWNRRYGR